MSSADETTKSASTVRVAAVQPESVYFGLQGAVKKTCRLIEEAASEEEEEEEEGLLIVDLDMDEIIIAGMITLSVVLFFRETRSIVVLWQRAKVLNRWYEKLEEAGCRDLYFPQPKTSSEDEKEKRALRIRWKVAAGEDSISLPALLRTSLSRPFLLLFTEPVFFFFSL
ncbi:hypothetical protein BDV06DRAFT_219235 [Aspergillus oleicola]